MLTRIGIVGILYPEHCDIGFLTLTMPDASQRLVTRQARSDPRPQVRGKALPWVPA